MFIIDQIGVNTIMTDIHRDNEFKSFKVNKNVLQNIFIFKQQNCKSLKHIEIDIFRFDKFKMCQYYHQL